MSLNRQHCSLVATRHDINPNVSGSLAFPNEVDNWFYFTEDKKKKKLLTVQVSHLII